MKISTLRDFLTTHPWMKTLSVVLAFVLWTFVHGEQHIEKMVTVKLQPKNIPSHLVTSRDAETSISIRVKGPRTRVGKLDESYFKPYSLDLADAQKGMNTFQVFEEDFSLPRGTRIVRMVPQMVRIFLDDAEEKLIRVEPLFVGQLEEGYELSGHEVVPPYLKVRGARSALEGLTLFRTEPISLSSRRAGFEGEYSVHLPTFISDGEERKVQVRVSVREREISKILGDVPVVVSGAAKAIGINPSKVALNVRGPAGEVAVFMGVKTEVRISASELGLNRRKPGVIRVRPALPKHPGIEITMIPDNVLLTILKD